MTDDVENLVLEHLRAIRADTSGLKDEIRGARSEITALRHQMHGMNTLVEQCLEDIGTIKVRLDRIERRLDLTEPAK
jgi:archaellum component FlaC